jgi:FkbM family methyltransferase
MLLCDTLSKQFICKEIKMKKSKIVLFSCKKTVCTIAFLISLLYVLSELGAFKSSEDRQYTIAKTQHGLLMALITNDYVSEIIKSDGVWESRITTFLANNIKPNEIVVELGAHIGYYTLLMAKLVSPGGHVYAYEVNDEVYNLAKFSLHMNKLSNMVTLKNIGIMNRSGEAFFSFYNPTLDHYTNIGSSYMVSPQKKAEKLQKKVTITSLDEDIIGLKNIDWLRMDIEGSELPALYGAKKIIESSPNLKIVTEWFTKMLSNFGNVSDLVDFLHGYGFRFYKIKDDGTLGDEIFKAELCDPNTATDIVLMKSNATSSR